MLLGGRAAEEVVFGEVSTGAHNDLQRATDIVRSIVVEYGMGETLGPLTYPRRRSAFLGDQAATFPTARASTARRPREAVDARDEAAHGRAHAARHRADPRQARAARPDRRLLLEREVLEAEEFKRIVAEWKRARAA